MRYLCILFFSSLLIACNNNKSGNPDTKDSGNKKPDSITNKPTAPVNSDSALLVLSEKILTAIKDTNYNQLATYIHPGGVAFSPYGHIDTLDQQILSPAALIDLLRSNKKIYWGVFDGSGDPINLTATAYFKKFVYDADFLHAPDKAVNHFIGGGNSLNNLQQVYPGCDYTEFHFKGFDKKAEGMDWTSVRLVFKTENKQTWLVAIVHDEWTI